MKNKSVIGFTIFIGIVSGLIFLGVIDKDPYQEEREIAAKAENQLKTALEKRIELIDEIVYRVHRLDEFFGESESSIQVLEDCERERKASEELLEEIRDEDYFISQGQFDINRLEKSNVELRELLREFKSFPEDENDLKKGRKITI